MPPFMPQYNIQGRQFSDIRRPEGDIYITKKCLQQTNACMLMQSSIDHLCLLVYRSRNVMLVNKMISQCISVSLTMQWSALRIVNTNRYNRIPTPSSISWKADNNSIAS